MKTAEQNKSIPAWSKNAVWCVQADYGGNDLWKGEF